MMPVALSGHAGAMNGLFSKLSMTEIRSRAGLCAAAACTKPCHNVSRIMLRMLGSPYPQGCGLQHEPRLQRACVQCRTHPFAIHAGNTQQLIACCLHRALAAISVVLAAPLCS